MALANCHRSMGDLQDPTDGATLVPYKTIFWGYIPLHSPET